MENTKTVLKNEIHVKQWTPEDYVDEQINGE